MRSLVAQNYLTILLVLFFVGVATLHEVNCARRYHHRVQDRSAEPSPIRLGRNDFKSESQSELQQDLARDIDRLLQEIEQEELHKGAALNQKDYKIFETRMKKLSWFQEYERLVQDVSLFQPGRFSTPLKDKYTMLKDKLEAINYGPQNSF